MTNKLTAPAIACGLLLGLACGAACSLPRNLSREEAQEAITASDSFRKVFRVPIDLDHPDIRSEFGFGREFFRRGFIERNHSNTGPRFVRSQLALAHQSDWISGGGNLWQISLASVAFADIEGISTEGSVSTVAFKWRVQPSETGLALSGYYLDDNDICCGDSANPCPTRPARAKFRLYDSGWKLEGFDRAFAVGGSWCGYSGSSRHD